MNGSNNLKLRKRKAPNIPGRLNWTCRGIESILERTENEGVQVTAAALQSLVLCHERFLKRMASELARSTPGNCVIAKGEHVDKALNELGLQHLLEPAMEAADTKPPAAKKKRKGSTNFTAEDRALQEQLLTASRERVLEGTSSK